VSEVAVVGFAQSPVAVRDDATTSGVEMLVPTIAEAFGACGLTKSDIGFWCSGSSDYLAGRAFSFVSAVDAIGAVPPTMESHVEMDGAWALYEAWVKVLTGDADIALAYGFGKSSGAELRRVMALQLDPYLVAPLWPDSVSVAALQARLGLEAGRWTEKDMAEVAARSRAAAASNPAAQVSGSVSAADLLARPYVAEPLRAHDCAPVGDGAAVVIMASAARARELCERPAWITGFAGRAGPAGGAVGGGCLVGGGRRFRCSRRRGRTARAVHSSGDPAARGDGTRRRRDGQPVRRRAVRQPDVRRRTGPDRRGGAGGDVRPGRAGPRPRDQRPGPAAEPGVRHVRGDERRQAVKQQAAVLGVGQTRHRSKRADVSMAGLCREAADRAVADAGLSLADIDAVVVGKAPDLFEGVMMPELYLADALGAVGKPLLRVHTAGSVGGATGNVAASLVQAGVHRRVLALAFEKQSESNAMWALSIAPPFSIPVVAGAGGYFAPHIRAYIRRSGAPSHIGALVAVKDRRNGALNPYAHLQQGDITLEKVQASPMLWDPVRYDETCPSSDGACAVVIGDAEAAAAAPGPVAWIRATSMRSEPTMFAGKDHVNPAAGRECVAALWRQAGITDPINEIDVAEIYVPFSWYEPMWLENLGFAAPGEGWRLTEAGETAIGGRIPVNPSGGVLSSNPIGASGLLRFAESALQVMGKAGDHQVDGARVALGHAYGGGSQFFSMWVVSADARSDAENGA
jgi:acetyl-CoA C-acetyltransferase